MGGVGDEPALPYRWLMQNEVTVRGAWMYPREAVGQMIRLVRSGLIDLAQFDLREFGLDQVNEAIAHAAENASPLQLTVLRPDRGRPAAESLL